MQKGNYFLSTPYTFKSLIQDILSAGHTALHWVLLLLYRG